MRKKRIQKKRRSSKKKTRYLVHLSYMFQKKIKKIRDCIKNYVKKNIRISSGMEGIARIEIKKRIDLIWALEGFGVAHILQEMLTYKSDHIRARQEVNHLLPEEGEEFKHLLNR